MSGHIVFSFYTKYPAILLCFLVLIQAVDQCLLSILYKCESVLFVVIGCTKEPHYSVKFVKGSFMCYISRVVMLFD